MIVFIFKCNLNKFRKEKLLFIVATFKQKFTFVVIYSFKQQKQR